MLITFWQTENVFTFAPTKNKSNGDIAQSVEQRTENPCVAGSIPAVTTKVTKSTFKCLKKVL